MKPSPRLSRPFALLALASLSVLAACDPEPASLGATSQRIVGGQPDTSFPAAVALTLDGDPFCSGVLVSPRKVVTSAACLGDGSSRLGPGQIEVFFGEQVGSGQSLAVAEVALHPDFSLEAPELLHNLAVLTLAEDAPTAPLAWQGTSLNLGIVGRQVSQVGFGADSAIGTGYGARRVIGGRIESIDAHQILATAGPCYGDSGGPMILELDGTPTVIGILSHADADCAQWSAYTRLDAEAAFLRAQLEPADAGEQPDAGAEEPDAGEAADAGAVDAGSEVSEDAGAHDAGSLEPADADQGEEPGSTGCGCASGASGLPAGAAALAVLLLAQRRRTVTG